MTDPIADFITRLRNASSARKKTMTVPYSNMKHAIANVLLRYHYIEDCAKEEASPAPLLKMTLAEDRGQLTVRRVSKPGQRIYIGAQDIRRVRQGFGLGIISTPEGVMSTIDAKKKNIGGELLCEIY